METPPDPVRPRDVRLTVPTEPDARRPDVDSTPRLPDLQHQRDLRRPQDPHAQQASQQ